MRVQPHLSRSVSKRNPAVKHAPHEIRSLSQLSLQQRAYSKDTRLPNI